MGIKEGLDAVLSNIESAALGSGRKPEDIKLVAGSKFKSKEEILDAYMLGVKDFGENYVREFTEKEPQLPADIKWHIIGPLQRNKVKYIADKNILLQTLDRVSLAEELSKHAQKTGKTIPVLLQVNTCMEETKSGCAPSELEALFDECRQISGISIKGVMTIGPNTDDVALIERDFEQTRELFERLRSKDANVTQLSMGMTNDYQLAIKHGATIVRVGRAIFGERY